MDGALEGAVVLCACKLVFSLLFLPSLAASHSAISFCCCCLLIFTDFLVTAFLGFLCVFESWLTELAVLSDIIALRFLLFLSHTYGLMLLLTTPLIAAETLTRLLRPHSAVTHRTSPTATDSDGQCYVEEVTAQEQEDGGDNPNNKTRLSHVVSYLCCLSVWVVVAINVRWRWMLEEVWAAACMHRTNSLIRCLPNLFSSMSSTLNPCLIMVFLSLLLLLLTMSTGLQRQHCSPAPKALTQREKRGPDNNSRNCWHDLHQALPSLFKPTNPGISLSVSEHCVDPEKTESSCTIHRACSWNSAQVSALQHRDFVIISPTCMSAGQDSKRTKTVLTLSTHKHMDSEHRSWCGWRGWASSCLGLNEVIGFVGVLSIFVLPLNLSVNILLIRTIDTLLELCIRAVVPSAANTYNISNHPNKLLP